MDNGIIAAIVLGVFAVIMVAIFIITIYDPHLLFAKVDVDTGAFPTTKDSNGFYHIRGWVKNITHNETDTDFSVEMVFTGGHFYKFALGQVTDLTKLVLPPHQTIYWDHSTKVPFAAKPYYNMQLRYNEIKFVTNLTASVPTPKPVPKPVELIPNSVIAGNIIK